MSICEDSELTRREVLGAGIGVAAGALLGGPLVEAARAAVERPELLPVSADVWASGVLVTGAPAGGTLTVDGAPVAGEPSGDGITAEVPLEPGANPVEMRAPGGRTAGQTYTARLRQGPTARAVIGVENGAVLLDASGSGTDPYTQAPIGSTQWSEGSTRLGEGTRLALPGPFADGEHYVSCRVTDGNGNPDTATAVFTVAGGTPSVPAGGWEAQWASDAVVYGVIPPLFGQPPLRAVTEALDRLAALGTTVLWLSPLFATLPGEFGYAVTDHFAVRPDYGTLADLQELVAEAHARGLRVILDMPLNDTSASHPYFIQAKHFKQAQSRYWSFYERDSHGNPVHYFSWRKLPNLSYENGEVRRLALEAAGYWIREADVDGFRCDAAWGVASRSPAFWEEWAGEVRRLRPDALLLAEAPASAGQYAEEGFTAAYDWGANLGEWSWQSAFPKHGPDLASLRAALAAPLALRPFRFLDNNDTGSRFITRNGAGITRAALALVLSLPGLPCVYTGEEIGAEYLPYEQSRPLAWSSDPDALEPLIAQLIAERRRRPALQTGTLQVLDAEPASTVLAVSASLAAETAVVVVNFAGAAQTASVRMPGGERVGVPLDPYGYAQLDG